LLRVRKLVKIPHLFVQTSNCQAGLSPVDIEIKLKAMDKITLEKITEKNVILIKKWLEDDFFKKYWFGNPVGSLTSLTVFRLSASKLRFS